MRTILLACGVLGPLLYGAADWLSGSRWDDYSFRDMTVSELGAIGAPTQTLFSRLVLAVYALLLAFGVGVWRSAASSMRLRAVGVLIVGLSLMAWVTAPIGATDLRGEGLSAATTLHLVLTTIGALAVLIAMGVGGGAFGRGFRVYSIASIVVLVGFAAWSGAIAARPGENLSTPWLGVVERFSFYSFHLWFMVLALKLIARDRASRSA